MEDPHSFFLKIWYSFLFSLGVAIQAIYVLFLFNKNVVETGFLQWPLWDVPSQLQLFFAPIVATTAYCVLVSLLFLSERNIIPPFLMAIVYSLVSSVIYVIATYFFYVKYGIMFSIDGMIFLWGSYVAVFIFWSFTWGLVSQWAVRKILGTHCDKRAIEKGVKSFKTEMRLADVKHKLDDKEWLLRECSLVKTDDESKNEKIQIRLNKLGTSYYLGLYAEKVEDETLFNIVPYEIYEDLVRKEIHINTETEGTVKYQIMALEEKLGLTPLESRILIPETVNFSSAPSRIPYEFIKNRGREIFVVLFGCMICVVGVGWFMNRQIDLSDLLVIISATITSVITLISILTRRP